MHRTTDRPVSASELISFPWGIRSAAVAVEEFVLTLVGSALQTVSRLAPKRQLLRATAGGPLPAVAAPLG